MADSKFSLHDQALEASTRTVIQPDHIMMLQVEEDTDAVVNPQILQPFAGAPEIQEERGEQEQFYAGAPELQEERGEQEQFYAGAPEIQEERGEQEQFYAGAPEMQEERGEQDAAVDMEDLSLDWIMGDAPDLPTFQELLHYLFGDNTVPDCVVPDYDSSDDESMEHISIEEDQPIPVNLLEAETPIEGDQPSLVNLQVADINAIIEGDQRSPRNLQVTAEDASTPRQLEVKVATTECVYSEPDREASPIVMAVQVQTVITTSADEGESSCSSRILMDIQVDQKGQSDSCELLSELVSEKDVNNTAHISAVEAGASDKNGTKALRKHATHDQLIKCSFSTSTTYLKQMAATTTFNGALVEPGNNSS